MIIKYSDYIPLNKPSLRLELYIKGNKKHSVDALLDSGADVTSIPASLSESVLGVNLQEMTDTMLGRLGGIWGASHCFCGKDIDSLMLPVQIRIAGIRFISLVNWVFGHDIDPVIGRRDIFECFNIEFRETLREIELKPIQYEIQKRQTGHFQRRVEKMENLIAEMSV